MVPEEAGGGCKVTVSRIRNFPNMRARSPRLPESILFLFFIFIALCCPPGLAIGYTYPDTGNQPSFITSPAGETEYFPGDTFEITVILANTGTVTAVQAAPRLAPGTYDPSTALGVTVRPGAGDAPVTVKTLPMMVGDIGSLDKVPVIIRGTVHQNASPGVYAIPLDVTYTYVYAIPMVGANYSTIEPLYREKKQTLPATIRVMSEVRPVVIRENSENLVPGSQGYLTLDIVNIGYGSGTDIMLRIVPTDNVTFQMVDDTIFLKRIEPGGRASIRVGIAVHEQTSAGLYPALFEGEYRNPDGIIRSIPPVPVFIKVSRGVVMEAVTRNLTIDQGGKEVITVSYLNTGDTPAYNAQARIIGSHVLMPVDDSAQLGTIGPGEIKTTQFVVSSENAIAGKNYVIDSEVKYRDETGTLMLSDNMRLGVYVTQPSGFKAITSNPATLIVIAGVLAILVYAGWKVWGKKRGRN